MEWPKGEVEPTRNWFSTLPQDSALKQLVATTKGCWMIEHHYLELESELGLDHFEGRGWRGFHHHPSLYIAAYGFLMVERLKGHGKVKRRYSSRAQQYRAFWRKRTCSFLYPNGRLFHTSACMHPIPDA